MAIRAVGLTLYGWKHFPDGTSFCRKWFMVLYLPILPLKRWKVISHNTVKTGFLEGIKIRLGIGGSLAAFEDNEIEFLEPIPGYEDIIPTYLIFWSSFLAIVAFDVGIIPLMTWLGKANIVNDSVFIWSLPVIMGLFFGLPIGFALQCHQYAFGIRRDA
jgi:hypothetical protein